MWQWFIDKIPTGQLQVWFGWLTFFTIVLPIIGGLTGFFAWKVGDRISDLKDEADKKRHEEAQSDLGKARVEAEQARKLAEQFSKKATELEAQLAPPSLILSNLSSQIGPGEDSVIEFMFKPKEPKLIPRQITTRVRVPGGSRAKLKQFSMWQEILPASIIEDSEKSKEFVFVIPANLLEQIRFDVHLRDADTIEVSIDPGFPPKRFAPKGRQFVAASP
jgi:hypothetical protein